MKSPQTKSPYFPALAPSKANNKHHDIKKNKGKDKNHLKFSFQDDALEFNANTSQQMSCAPADEKKFGEEQKQKCLQNEDVTRAKSTSKLIVDNDSN